jgi:hypothetical protein
MSTSTPEYSAARVTELYAEAPNRQTREYLAQRRAERREKLVNLVQAIRKAITRITPIAPTNRVELEATTLAIVDGHRNEEIRL